MIRIFISFASSSLHLAEKLHEALTKRAATVFQFEKSARAGKSAWDQVYDNIQDADYFVCLLSREAIKSRPVQKEVGYADYCNTNNDGRPELVPILVDSIEPTKWPKPLRVLTPLDLSDCQDPSQYASGVSRVVETLGIDDVAGEQHPTTRDDAEEREGGDGVSESPAPEVVALRMQGWPETSEAPSTVEWEIEVENVGTGDLEAVRVALDGQEIEEPFFVAAGETRRFTRSSRYKAPGRKTRRLRAHVISSDGARLLGELVARVNVTSPPTQAAEESEVAESELSDAEVRARLEAAGSDFSWATVIFPLLVLALGAAATWGSVLLSSYVLGYVQQFVLAYPVEALPTFPLEILSWISSTGWFHWASGLLAGGFIAIGSFLITADEIPIDAGDYAKVAFKSASMALLVSGIWAIAHIEGYPLDTLAFVVGGAVALSSVTVAIFALIDEI